jgi:DNA-binding response OmpR family regulator
MGRLRHRRNATVSGGSRVCCGIGDVFVTRPLHRRGTVGRDRDSRSALDLSSTAAHAASVCAEEYGPLTMYCVLLVEDDDALREATVAALTRDGFHLAAAGDGVAGLEVFRARPPDIVLLDVMLPVLDGVSVCRAIRAESVTPVMMLSARGDPIDVVLGLEAGADDYVTKPFDAAVLAARIRAVLRRTERLSVASQTRVGRLEIDESAMVARWDGTLVALTTTEFRLLADLARNVGIVRTRPALLSDVWGYEWAGDTRLVDVHVQRLRAKLGSPAIETVRGVGYRLARA